jgi:hypothetical protein
LTFATFAVRKVLLSTFILGESLSAVGGAGNASNLNAQRASSERTHNMKINIKIGAKIVIATLADNETARDFLSLLPLNLSMNDLFGREKFGKLPRALSETSPRTNSYKVGEIAYWPPDHDIAIYYRQDGESIPSPGVIPVAKIDAGAEEFNVPGSVKVTIDVSK